MRHLFSVQESYGHAVIAVLSELFQRLWGQPLSPLVLKPVDLSVLIRRVKRLLGFDPGVVVAKHWHDCDILIFDCLLQHLSCLKRVANFFIRGVLPNIMG